MMATLVGATLGLATGLVPGLHVNTIAVVMLTTVAPSEASMLALVAIGTVHTFVGIVPSTYLGAPDEDTALSVLPAHQLLLAGQGPAAIRISVVASLAALVAAAALILPYKWVLLEPGQGLRWLERGTPWIMAGVVIALLVTQRHRRWVAGGVFALAGLLGWVVLGMVLPNGASPLLPLLSGLFGAPTLLWSLQTAPALPCQARPAPGRRRVRDDVARGVAASLWTAVLPGLTSAVATALASVGKKRSPESVIATLSAVNTAHAALAMPVLWMTAHARTGLAQAVATLPIESWQAGAPPRLLVLVLAVALAAGVIGAVGTLAVERLIRGRVHRVPSRTLASLGLSVLVAMVVWFTGWPGLIVFTVAAAVGALPLIYGVRRVNLVGCLLVPILIYAWT